MRACNPTYHPGLIQFQLGACRRGLIDHGSRGETGLESRPVAEDPGEVANEKQIVGRLVAGLDLDELMPAAGHARPGAVSRPADF